MLRLASFLTHVRVAFRQERWVKPRVDVVSNRPLKLFHQPKPKSSLNAWRITSTGTVSCCNQIFNAATPC